jgi:hypothetical protein
MPVSVQEIQDAFDFVNIRGLGENQAFLCIQSGKIYWHSEFSDFDEFEDELPEDVDDDEKYLAIPDARELDLGKPLALDFARQVLPEDFVEVRQIFSKRGAYANFKHLLAQRHMLEKWYEFEEKATHRDGDRLVIEPVRRRGLVALHKTMKPLDEDFPGWTILYLRRRSCFDSLHAAHDLERSKSRSHQPAPASRNGESSVVS